MAANEGIRVAVRPFRVDVDQAHLYGRQGVFQLPVAGVTALGLVARSQPFIFGTPVGGVIRLPDILAPEAEAEGLEAHRLQGAIAGEDNEVGPGDLFAVFLLDRPEQPARLVETHVVGPAVEGRKALGAGSPAPAAVADAVGARAVPRHPDEEPPVVTEIGRPPVLRVGHQRIEVLLQGLQVEFFEFLSVVELLAHRIAHGRVLVKNLQVQLVRPPVPVRRASAGSGFVSSARYRALAIFIHKVSSISLSDLMHRAAMDIVLSALWFKVV